eukprot:6425557-Pyramimonas_sp.AAC.1
MLRSEVLYYSIWGVECTLAVIGTGGRARTHSPAHLLQTGPNWSGSGRRVTSFGVVLGVWGGVAGGPRGDPAAERGAEAAAEGGQGLAARAPRDPAPRRAMEAGRPRRRGAPKTE